MTSRSLARLGPPERYGRDLRSLWGFEEGITYLNHGTVGATPLAVLEEQAAVREEIERQPSRYLLRELTAAENGRSARPRPRLREAAAEVAAHFGARGEDLVFVDNVTTGVNGILRSFPLEPGDEIVVTDQTYGAIAHAARYAAREKRAEVRVVALPDLSQGPVDGARFSAAIAAAVGPRSRLVIADHMPADTAVVLPIAEIVARCRARGAAVLVDGAHVPGALELDIPSIGADWYVGNLHKWAMAPRSSALLWAAPERQAQTRPAVVSWGFDQGFTREFDLPGTRDPSPHLAAAAGLEFLRRLDLPRLRQHNQRLALFAGRALARFAGIGFEVPEAMIGSMASVPLPVEFGSTRADALELRDHLLFDAAIEVHAFARGGRVWLRVACQAYNDEGDIERLLAALERRRRLGARS